MCFLPSIGSISTSVCVCISLCLCLFHTHIHIHTCTHTRSAMITGSSVPPQLTVSLYQAPDDSIPIPQNKQSSQQNFLEDPVWVHTHDPQSIVFGLQQHLSCLRWRKFFCYFFFLSFLCHFFFQTNIRVQTETSICVHWTLPKEKNAIKLFFTHISLGERNQQVRRGKTSQECELWRWYREKFQCGKNLRPHQCLSLKKAVILEEPIRTAHF